MLGCKNDFISPVLLSFQLKVSDEWKDMLDILRMKWSLNYNVSQDYMQCRAICQLVGNSVSVIGPFKNYIYKFLFYKIHFSETSAELARRSAFKIRVS